MTFSLRIKRIYDAPSKTDGYRILIDRLWPRGLSKDAARIDEWVKEIAPSHDLRRWFNHKPERWAGFQERYRAELTDIASQTLLDDLVAKASEETVTLLFAAKDTSMNNAVVVKAVLDELFERTLRPR